MSNPDFVNPPFVPDRYLSRLKELPIGILIGALWNLAVKHSTHEGAANVIAKEIAAIREYQAWALASADAAESLGVAA